ncbi:hypothetical protein EKN06_03760 [Croceicoccus ponticola]|uniref:WYL domain-containing protein n=1 Tax=Croceicoccus ponticola TaxID=2217664 RepID=A0A437H1A2_9SPHN|nr:hypothetical protein [Croceicoccus ponticola]RVQ69313.1 hypothetical protein EKN06_03760 [Croceicoccus ponticola]
MALRDLIATIVKPRLHGKFEHLLDSDLSVEDDHDDLAVDEDLSPEEAEQIAGLNLVIEYQNAKGELSQRIITCKHLQVRADKHYIKAYCHHRRSIRSFRKDRVIEIFDPITGESLNPVDAYFAQFAADVVPTSGLSWGLSINRRASLIALLNALVFLARCDKNYHPFERLCIEQAITKFWLEFELLCDCDMEDILSYADRLSPDGEVFWLAMHKFKSDPILAKIFQRTSRLLIEADGIVQNAEAFWAIEIDDFLNGSH